MGSKRDDGLQTAENIVDKGEVNRIPHVLEVKGADDFHFISVDKADTETVRMNRNVRDADRVGLQDFCLA